MGSSLKRGFHQLWLLMWRNVLIRWRSGSLTLIKPITVPCFQLMEVLWPLVLYAILAILRNTFPPEDKPDTKYRAYALPSAGTLPFLQTLFCDIGTKSDPGPYSDMPTFPNATVNGLYTILDEVGTLNASWTEVCSYIHSVNDQLDCLNNSLTGCAISNPDSVPLSCYLEDPADFRDFLSSNLSLSPGVVEGISGATVNTSEVTPSSLLIPTLLGGCTSSFAQLRGVHFANISSADVQRELCNVSNSQWLDFIQELQEQMTSKCNPTEVGQSVLEVLGLQHLLEQSDLVELFNGFSEAEWSSQDPLDATESEDEECPNPANQLVPYFCGDFRENATDALRSFFTQSCNGDTYRRAQRQRQNDSSSSVSHNTLKILYAPHTNLTRSIIKKANRTFDTFGDVIKLADEVANCSQFFLDNIKPEQLDFIRQGLEQMILLKENGNISLLANVSLDSLLGAQYLLNTSNAPNDLWSIMSNIHNVSSNIHDSLMQFNWDIFLPLEDEQEMEALAGDYQRQDELGITYVVAGIVFESDLTANTTSTTIKIRTNFSAVVDPLEYKENIWYPGPEDDPWKKRYIIGFFIFVQDMVERAMMEEIVGSRVASPGVYLQEMPYPCYKKDRFTISMLYVLPLAMLFAWMFPIAMTTRAVVREKETRLKEFMKMMGVGEGLLRLSWFIHSMLVLMFSVVGVTLLLKLGGILPATNGFLLLLFLTQYAVVMLSYSFLVSAFFNNANLAACVSALLYFMVFFAHVTIVPNLNSLSPVVIGLCCLWAPLAFSLGSTFLVQWELRQQGIAWSNLAIPAVADDHLSFIAIVVILGIDTVLYFLATWYIEGVFPGRYGVSKPWYFPFMPSYWCGRSVGQLSARKGHVRLQEEEEEEEEMAALSSVSESGSFEEEPTGLPLGISIIRLSKEFTTGFLSGKKKTLAVNDLSLNFYEGQITAFLGHNGAGKTTTMSVLTGLFEPSKGTAHIYGMNIRKKMDAIRQNLGMCPQHNILIDQLTVAEHLEFYGQLKGLSRAEAKVQVLMWLDKFDLKVHRHKYTRNLSGGMKRKLSILLAFVGNCSTIILDEPTSGVDPYSRQQIWEFLLRHRQGRTIMLSTHHMDEAEILGDRIAIISKGSLLCCGSFDYLKHRFGRGHRLTLVTKVQSDRRASVSSRTFTVTADVEDTDMSADATGAPREPIFEECAEAELTTLIQQVITGAALIERRGREVHYRLPLLHARPRILAKLFTQLEEEKGRLGIMSYGMSSCTMEEIFVQLTEQELAESEQDLADTAEATESQSTKSQGSQDQADSNAFDEEGLLFGDVACDDPLGSGSMETNNRLTSWRLWLMQFYALLVKRLHYTKGHLLALTVQNLLPLVVICFSLLISHTLQAVPDPPPLELSPHLFFAKADYNYLFAGGYYTNETAPMVDSLFQPHGIAAPRLSNNSNNSNNSSDTQCSGYPQQQYSCSCEDCAFLNESVLPTIPPCYNKTVSGSRVVDVTVAYNMSESYNNVSEAYNNVSGQDLELHNYLLHSTDAFTEQRYGGVSFGHFKEEVAPIVDKINANSSSTLPFLAARSVAKAWYSLKGYHAMPAYLNTLNNAILRAAVSEGDPLEYGIRTISHPFNLTDLEKTIYSISEKVSFLVNPLAVVFSLGFVVAGFVLLLIEERSANIKHLQLMCGMNKLVYWLSTFLWDLLWFVTFVVLVMILFAIFRDPYVEEMFLFFVLLLCYGLAAIPWMYASSFIFSSSATAYVLLFCLNFFSGFCLLIVDFVLVQVENSNSNNLLHYYLLGIPFPSYALSRSMMYIGLDRPLLLSAAAYSTSPFTIPNPFSELMPFMLSMLGQGLFYTALVVAMELAPILLNKISCRKRRSLPPPRNEDAAVTKERRQVTARRTRPDDLLMLNNLTKIYGSRWSSQYRLAVNQLCLRMKKAECFGLLGVNGAGKTSTFRMLTGDTSITSGEVVIEAHHAITGGRKAMIGYCPQVDALIDSLTGRQHLQFYSRLRGLPPAHVKKVVDWALLKLGLMEYADKQASAYSGGNRRKLSTAIALLARPPLILLDEPTSGVDPRARQFLWSIVKGLVSAGQSVLLTTHSMAECEALCSRVGIMVNGSFRCLGSPQQLKSTYGQGYKLKIRSKSQVEAVKEFIRQNFSTSILKEEHYNTLLYQLPNVEEDLSTVFNLMESSRETLDIEDYSLSQTTLNDVFVHFANEQSEDVGLHALESQSPSPPPPPSPAALPDIVTDIPV